MKRFAPFIIVIAVALATVLSAVLLYRSNKPTLTTIPLSNQIESNRTEHVLGNQSAKLTLEEYGDFQCPPCGKLSQPLNELVRQFQPNLRLIYRDFPLPMHLHAREAAVAAEAAGLQGKFWEMHDLLYQEQAAWSVAKDIHLLFNGYAKTLGLDEQRFASDMAGPKVNDLVSSDEKRGASLGVKNTPTIFLNNKAVDPKTYNPTELQTAIETALGEKEKSQHST